MAFASIGILGGGSWATALVKIFAENENIPVNWWLRNEDHVSHINKFGHNPAYLGSVQININRVSVSSDINKVVENSDLLILAVPSAFLDASLRLLKNPEFLKNKKICSAIKGIVPETGQIVARYLEDKFGVDALNIAVIGGPCHAEEVALEKLSYLTVSSLEEGLAQNTSNLLQCRYINCKTNSDIYGAEYASVLKNIYSIGAGICHGIGFGDNFQAVLVSNAIMEMEQFLDAIHQAHRDVKETAYLGDLLVTAYSQFSRNRTFGNMLGKGYSVKSAQLEMDMIAEGFYAVAPVYDLAAKSGLNLPILTFVYNVVNKGLSAQEEAQILTKKLNS